MTRLIITGKLEEMRLRTKISKIILHPRSLLILWIVFVCSPLLSFFRRYFLVSGGNYYIQIKGASTLIYYFPIIISILTLIVLFCWFRNIAIKGFDSKYLKTIYSISFSSFIVLIAIQYLLNMERQQYPNFLYTYYGLTIQQLETMFFVASMQLMIFIIFVFLEVFQRDRPKLYKRGIEKSKIGYIYNKTIVFTVIGISGALFMSIKTVFNWSNLYEQEKGNYETRVGSHYMYMNALEKCTSENISVIHPPQGDKWPAIGNQPVLRYFLFPRRLISGALFTNQDFASRVNHAYFAEIDPESSYSSWPLIIYREKHIIFDERTKIRYQMLDKQTCNDGVNIFSVKF